MTLVDMAPSQGRVLTAGELEAYVRWLAARPELWRHHVAFGGKRRHFASIFRDDHIDVWLLCWDTDDDTGWHDHDTSSGAVAVVRGRVRETRLRIFADPMTADFPAGTTLTFGPDHIHRMTGAVAESVSIHAYSPPLWRVGQYFFGPDGVMRRTSVSYAEELRPLDAA